MLEQTTTNIPDAPAFATAAANMKDAMLANPEQASQIMACLGALKNASGDNYGAYVSLCTQLDLEPVTEEAWAKHDRAHLTPLVAASLKKNFPDKAIAERDIIEVIDACQEKNRTLAAKRIMGVLLKLLGAKDEQIASWTKLGLAALSFI